MLPLQSRAGPLVNVGVRVFRRLPRDELHDGAVRCGAAQTHPP